MSPFLTATLVLLATTGSTQSTEAFTVGAVNYTGYAYEDYDSYCDDEGREGYQACEVELLVRTAAEEGAHLVVVSEYAFEIDIPELDPVVGRRPPRHADIQDRFSGLANDLDIYLVIALETRRREDVYSTQVAFDPRGIIVAVHHKIEPWGAEADELTAGTDVTTFDTPFGRVGLMICSDVYAEPEVHEKMVDLGVRIVALSTAWTVEDATRWQAAFAHDWGVFLVAANGSPDDGRGGGIYAPDGSAMTLSTSGYDDVFVATLAAP
jgi:predicted amidohydrolase